MLYDRAWEMAPPYDRAWEKDLSYTWYISIYTKYTLGLMINISYTSVYNIIYQVYDRMQEYMTVYTRFMVVLKRLCRYILMTSKYILVPSTATSTATSDVAVL